MFWLVTLCLFASVKTQFIGIPNHDEKIYIDKNENVSSIVEAQSKCGKLQAIPLNLWRIKVLDFVCDRLKQG